MGRGAGKRRPWQQLGGGSQKIKLAALTEAAGRSCIRSGNVDENWTRLKRGAGLGCWEPGVGTAVVGRPPKTRAGVPPPPAVRPRPTQGPELGLPEGNAGCRGPCSREGAAGAGAAAHLNTGLADWLMEFAEEAESGHCANHHVFWPRLEAFGAPGCTLRARPTGKTLSPLMNCNEY